MDRWAPCKGQDKCLCMLSLLTLCRHTPKAFPVDLSTHFMSILRGLKQGTLSFQVSARSSQCSLYCTILSAEPIFSSFGFLTIVVPQVATSCGIRRSQTLIVMRLCREIFQSFDLLVPTVCLLTAVFDIVSCVSTE